MIGENELIRSLSKDNDIFEGREIDCGIIIYYIFYF